MKWMNHIKRFSVVLAVLWTTVALAQNISTQPPAPSSAADQQSLARDLDGKRGHDQVDLFTGSFTYSIPVACAPARNGSEPNLALAYSSGNDSGWCGMSWNLNVGDITRNTKDGFPIQYSTGNPATPINAYDDSKGFILNLFGKQYKLLPTSTANEFDAEVDTEFLHCVCDTNNNKWTVYDKSGNAYSFGRSSNSRVTNPKTGWSGGYNATFQWGLDQIVTALGDQTTVAYTNYTSGPDTGLPERTIYPLQMAYNGNSNGAGTTHTITFGTEIRPDRRFSYHWGFRTEQNRRLTNIVCQVNGQKVWRYALGYTTSPATGRSLLTSLTVFGSDDTTALPVQTFTYQANPNAVSFGPPILWTNANFNEPGGGGAIEPYPTTVDNVGYTTADLMDIDGDGLPDRVMYDNTNHFLVQRNLGIQGGSGSFGSQYSFGPSASSGTGNPSASTPVPSSDDTWAAMNSQRVRLRDVNGDGLPDKVCDYWLTFQSGNGTVSDPSSYTNLDVMLNTGSGFSSITAWTNINPGPGAAVAGGDADLYDCIESGGVDVGFLDLNGDGLPDRVLATYYTSGAMTNFLVQFNTGTNFTAPKQFGPYHSLNWNNYPGGQTSYNAPYYWAGIETPDVHMIDINGDGLPDRVMWPMDPANPGLEAYIPFNSTVLTNYCVEYDDGYSFESTNTSTKVPGAYDVWPGVWSQANSSYNYAAMINLPYVGLYDLNGDGLPDRVMLDESSMTNSTSLYKRWLVYLNNGHGFNTTPIVVTNILDQSQSGDRGWWGIQTAYTGGAVVSLIDMNGDGLLDRVMAVYNTPNSSNYFVVQLNQGPYPDLLTNIANGMGGAIGVTYLPSTAYQNYRDPNNPNGGSLLPFPKQTVSTVTESDGVNPAQTTAYGYLGGFYDGNRREFHGFAMVSVTNPPTIGISGNRRTVYYFHQGGGQTTRTNLGEYLDPGNFAKEGMKYRVESYGNDNNLYHVTVSQVNQTSLGNARYFPFTQLTFDCDYAGGVTSSNRVTATQFFYDPSNGNLTNKIEYGEVSGFNPTNTGGFAFTDVNTADTRSYNTHYTAIGTYIVDHPDKTTLTDSGNNVIQETDFSYNSPSGTLATKLTRIASGYFATNSYGYNSYNLVNSKTDPVGVQTTISYDSAYNIYPASTTVGGTFTTTASYDARSGLETGVTDPMNVTVTNTYDTFYRLTESDKIPVGGTSVWMKKAGYNLGVIANGNAVSYIAETNNDGVGGVESRTYVDGFGRPIQTCIQGEAGNYRVVSTAYDERGKVFLTTWSTFGNQSFNKPSGSLTATWIGFDAAGRAATNCPVNASFNSNGAFTNKAGLAGDSGSPLGTNTWSYVNSGDPWWIVCTDADGKVRRYGLDAFGRTNQIQEVDGANTYTTTLKYDLADNLTNIVNNNAENIYYAYNDAGGLVAMADPYLGQWTYVRDYANRLRVQTDARGDVVSNSYVNSSSQQDPLGRLQTQTVYGTNYTNHVLVPAFTNTFTYDTVYKGLLYQVTDSEGSDTNGYDTRGRLITTTRHLNINSNNYTTSYTYNDGDKVTTITYPNGGPVITNAYFTGGTIQQVSRVGGSAYYTVSAANIDEFGHVTNFSYGNGLTTARGYYSTSKRLSSITCGTVFSRTYQYSAGDDVTFINGTGVTNVTVTYDNLHRIKTFTGLTGNYGYDSVGNMTTNIESGSAVAYSYANPRKQAVRTAFGYTNLYDLCGNMIVRHGGLTNSQAMVYDADNRLKIFSQAGKVVVEYGYAADGTRLWKRMDQNTNQVQIWIGNNYEEKNDTNGVHKVLFHVFAGGQQVCTFEPTSTLNGGGNTTNVGYYYHEDNLNSSCVLSGPVTPASQLELDSYYPFGRNQIANPQTTLKVSRQFTGQVKDDETGLYFFGNKGGRYYDPELGRFIQADDRIPDLSNPQSYNRYSYCLGNPLKYTDPSGHYGVSDWWRDVNQGAGIVSGWVSSAGRSIANTIQKPFVVPSVAPEPNSYQALMVQNGTPLFPDMKGANNPAVAVVKAGGGALLQAGMMLTPAGEEEVGGLAVKEGASILKNAERGRAAEAKVLNEMGLVKNTQKVSTAAGNAIPDALTDTISLEVKDAKVVNRTKQIAIETDAAKASGQQSVLVTGSKTQISGPAQKSFDTIIKRPDLGPHQ